MVVHSLNLLSFTCSIPVVVTVIMVGLTTLKMSSIAQIFDVSFLLGKAQVIPNSVFIVVTICSVDSVSDVLTNSLCYWTGLCTGCSIGCKEEKQETAT